jgi:hypothetical protein
MPKLSSHEKIDKKTLAEAKKIERLERQILRSEQTLTHRLNKRSIKALGRDGYSRREIGLIHRSALHRVRKHKLIVGILAIFGAVLVWRGVWNIIDVTPILKNDLTSVTVGLLILWLLNKYTDQS